MQICQFGPLPESELTSPHQLAVDKNYHTACPKVLYRADHDRRVFPKIYLDQADHRHVYLAFQNQVSASMEVVTCWCCMSVPGLIVPFCVFR